ncbi:hypothetical protein MSTHC_0893 [Methanosarcina thermophila CHTI-55]|uniref:Uncharacterized protein n=1 Tax=Methanosarcina thermophila CHTI-55 TaxID=1434121 RepID=A0A0E3NFW8_METTE|nr:hypothetical protein MSTHC_0893 [Methanosarcina thermophila CHTI-55]
MPFSNINLLLALVKINSFKNAFSRFVYPGMYDLKARLLMWFLGKIFKVWLTFFNGWSLKKPQCEEK